MVKLKDIVKFCNERTSKDSIKDFPGSWNGLQVENNGKVTKIGAAVDAGTIPFEMAKKMNIDFIIVHHGLLWGGKSPVTDSDYAKYKTLFDNNIAVYSSHLPLDAHPEIGNNAIIAKMLDLKPIKHFAEYEGTNIGLIVKSPGSRKKLTEGLEELFPSTFKAIEFGSSTPKKIAISSGSGNQLIPEIIKEGVDTLITGELKQSHFNLAQELKLNLYPCGHYATEVFGVTALGVELSEAFDLPFEFINTNCIL